MRTREGAATESIAQSRVTPRQCSDSKGFLSEHPSPCLMAGALRLPIEPFVPADRPYPQLARIAWSCWGSWLGAFKSIAEPSGNRIARGIRRVNVDFHPKDLRIVEGRVGQQPGSLGGDTPAQIPHIDPVPNLQGSRPDSGHQPTTSNEPSILVKDYGEVSPVLAAEVGDCRTQVIVRRAVGGTGGRPRHPRAKVITAGFYGLLQRRTVGEFVTAQRNA